MNTGPIRTGAAGLGRAITPMLPALKADPDVAAICVAIPHRLQTERVIMAVRHGKHEVALHHQTGRRPREA